MTKRTHSFVWGGIVAAFFFIVGLCNTEFLLPCLFLTLSSFTLIGCLILDNNFVGEMIVEVLSWGFVRMPGVIFTLDLDGLIWLLSVKLLFWIIGLLLAVAFGILAIGLGLAISILVYPFALYKNITKGEDAL